jgi:hypothetical protein
MGNYKVMSRRKIIILLLLIFVVLPLVSFGLYLIFGGGKSNTTGQEVTYIDKDTEEQVSTFEGVNKESVGNTEVLLLGLTPLNNDLLKFQYNFVREQIGEYAKVRLNNTYDIIALLPESYRNNKGVISGLLRLGKEGNTTVPITITSSNRGDVRVIIDDPENKFGGQYDSGMVSFYGD